jgi:hypothetical protein
VPVGTVLPAGCTWWRLACRGLICERGRTYLNDIVTIRRCRSSAQKRTMAPTANSICCKAPWQKPNGSQ